MFNCFPVSNSACNSFSIDCSKFSTLPAIWSISANSAPNCLAAITAVPISSAVPPNETWITAEVLAI